LAQAAPIPLPEPVITMALPSNSCMSVSTDQSASGEGRTWK
jgi:hypothetical protein